MHQSFLPRLPPVQPALQPTGENAALRHSYKWFGAYKEHWLMTCAHSFINTPRATCKGVGWLVVTLATMLPTMMEGNEGNKSVLKKFEWAFDNNLQKRTGKCRGYCLSVWTLYDFSSSLTVFNSCDISLPGFLRVTSSSSSVRTIFNVLATLSLKTTSVATPLEWKLTVSSPNWPSTFANSVLLAKWYHHSAHTTPLAPLYSNFLYDFALASQKSLTESCVNFRMWTIIIAFRMFMEKTTTFPMIPSLCSNQITICS